MNVKELIKLLNDMVLLYGNDILLKAEDENNKKYYIESISGHQCAEYFEPKDHVAEVILSIKEC